MPHVPITVLTGFLGSGKTTLLNKILRDTRYIDSAVIVNEFGDIDIDGDLIERVDERLTTTTTGCLCCTIRGDIRSTLLDLHERRRHADVPPFRRVIVETTGLADPIPVLHTLMSDPELTDRFSWAGVVTTVDAMAAEQTFDRHPESIKQIAVADRIVLTKSDLLEGTSGKKRLEALRRRIACLNPAAPILNTNHKGFGLKRLFDASHFDPTSKTADVTKWLNEEAFAAERNAHHDHHHEHIHAHDINRHDDSIHAFRVILDKPLTMMTFIIALENMIASYGADILRIKGLVNIREKPDTPAVLHGVQHYLHPPIFLERWPTEDKRTRLVFITRDVPRSAIEALFKAWERASAAIVEDRQVA